MISRPNPLIRLFLAVALGLLILRLLPVIVRVAQAAAVGLRGYGLILIGALIAVWVVRRVRRQKLHYYKRDPVTNHPTVEVVSEVSNSRANKNPNA